MQVSSWDVCTQGFERLRSQSEILFTALVDEKTPLESIHSEITDQINQLDCDYDHDALRHAVKEWLDNDGSLIINSLRGIQPGNGDTDESWCHLFVYVDTE